MKKLLKSSLIFLAFLLLELYLILAANFKIWNIHSTDLKGALFVLVAFLAFNFIYIKFFSNNLNDKEKKIISTFVIIFNSIAISGLIASLDYSALSFFGLKLEVGLYLPKYLFLFALAIGISLMILARKIKESKGLYYPFNVSAIYSFLLAAIYILNFNYFYNLFKFGGVFSHTEESTLALLSFIAFVLAIVLPLIINKIKSKK